jgi:hypothetical protein
MQSIQLIGNELENKIKSVSVLMKSTHENNKNLKDEIMNLAILWENVLLSQNKPDEIKNIYQVITTTLRVNNPDLDYKFINRKVFEALEKHTEYFVFDKQKETRESEENSTYSEMVTEFAQRINKININKLTREQAETFIKKLEKVTRSKINEAKQEYDINTKDEMEMSPLDEIETSRVTTERETETVQPDEVSWKIQELRILLDKLFELSCHYHAPTQFIKEKMLSSLERTIERIKIIMDKKDKATFEDWSNISLYSEEYKPNAGRLVKFKTSYCTKCKEIDDELDAEGKKGIYRHIEMKREYNQRFDPQKPYEIQDIYIWRCPKCKGTESLELSLTPERIKSNYRHVIEVNTQCINEAGFDNMIEIFGKSCFQIYKSKASKGISNKLLSKK